MALRRPGDKPLSEPMLVNLPAHIYVTPIDFTHIRMVISVAMGQTYKANVISRSSFH